MQELLKEADDLLERVEHISRFSDKYNHMPYSEAQRIIDKMRAFAEALPSPDSVTSFEAVLLNEIARRVRGEAEHFANYLSSHSYSYEQVLQHHAIPQEDIDALKPWLEAHRAQALETIDRLFRERKVEEHNLQPLLDIPKMRQNTEVFAADVISKFHRILSRYFNELTQVGEHLKNIDAQPTVSERSYFNQLYNTLALAILRICKVDKSGMLIVDYKSLISSYGHEGMGHAVNAVLSRLSDLPSLTKRESRLVVSSQESVAQFYEKRIFEDLKNNLSLLRELGIDNLFGEIYQDALDTRLLDKYNLALFQYGITVLADKSLGEPRDPESIKRRIERLAPVALSHTFSNRFVIDYLDKYDPYGNLRPNIVAELKYCAKPVQRALALFAEQGITYENGGRSLIDRVLLTGYWTPQGFVDNARHQALINKPKL